MVEATPPWRRRDLLRAFAVLWPVAPALYPVADRSLLMPLNRALAEPADATSSDEFALAIGALQRAARAMVASGTTTTSC